MEMWTGAADDLGDGVPFQEEEIMYEVSRT